MFTGRVTITGMGKLQKNARKRRLKATDVRGLAAEFEDYYMGKRRRQMWSTPGGVIRGRYGKGSKAWRRNAPSTIRQKGFNKPLYSSRGPYGSSILKGYEFRWGRRYALGARTCKAKFTIKNKVKHSIYLHEGTPTIPARPHIGFVDGDAKWLSARAAKRAIKV